LNSSSEGKSFISALRKHQSLPSFRKSKKRRIDIQSDLNLNLDENARASDEIVRVSGMELDISILRQHWKLSSQIRLNKISDLKDSKITAILNEYSGYKRPDGALLVNIIFLFFEKKT